MSNENNIAPINEDLNVAKLYCCETKYVNRVVKRKVERFPEEFCFQLIEEEYNNLKLLYQI